MTHSVSLSTAETPVPGLSLTAATGFTLSLAVAGTAVMAGLGTRWGLWHYTIGFLLLRVAVVGGLLSAVISLIGAVIARPESMRPGFKLAVLGLVISFSVLAVLLSWYATVRHVPRIHDITTDFTDPPQYQAVIPLRAHATNSTVYGGPDVAAQQKAAYPDVKPAVLEVTAVQAFDRALSAARSLGWTIVQENRDEGRIEATDRTFWFGFTDDIVVRVRPEGSGSRVDIRSLSRVGISDVGTNAARVRNFLKKLEGA